ncbi:Rta1 domain protein [Neofusicoccum parvum]|uniref:Rta1 domain protein n=1 Tax=Neofusicoccum parvum TaxID=310453 RepID=A0ACB5S8Z5_9PEZI|nr:Rta1 domain protein [Neofusicoccum parvum]GME45123.1 Rta1 domain protein [Neofusicoccum parvum]
MALSALHLAHLHHDDRHYSATSARHWDAALRGASAELASPSAHPDSIYALYAFAVTSCFYTLARGPQQAGDLLVCVVDDGAAGGRTTADWLVLYHGVRSLIDLSSDRVLDGPLAPLSSHARRQLRRNRRSKPGGGGGGGGGITTASAEEGEGERGKEGGGRSSSGSSAALRKLRLQMDRDDDEPNLGTYEKAVDSLEFAWEVVEAEERRGGGGALAASFQAFFWLYRVSDDFVLCLQQRQPMALVIYAHFVVLIKTMDWTWIIGNWPSHLIAQIYGSLDESWRVRVRWPMEQVSWQP